MAEASPPPSPALAPEFPPLDTTSPQLTVRAVLTGMILGATLSLCNVYAGLKVGWGFNMSITACLLAFGFWGALRATAKTRELGPLENNINQTAASAAASISSAGLVAGIPALTILTGHVFSWPVLASFTFATSLCGIVVAVGVRKQLLFVDKLPFPSGIATAETLKRMYGRGKGAMIQVWALVGAAAFSGALKLYVDLTHVPKWPIPLAFAAKGAAKGAGLRTITFQNLTVALDPSILLFAMGAIVGIRAGASMLLGALIVWVGLAPWLLAMGWVEPGAPDAPWFKEVVTWTLWPGVAMMVAASLTSFAFSWRAIVSSLRPGAAAESAAVVAPGDDDNVSRRAFVIGLAVALVFASITQIAFFDVSWWTAPLGVLMTFALALVAGRVTGETGVTPVGAMGKITQLMFGVIQPGSAAANLMSATVTGGAASQTGDLLHDLKTGAMIGASPRQQAYSQTAGALAGALAGSAGYLILIPDPAGMLVTEEWPAPAVVTWKAVAEVFMRGLEAMPEGAPEAMVIAASLGILLAVLEKMLPAKIARFIPSPSAIGLAGTLPLWNALSVFAGGVVSVVAHRWAPSWSTRFLIVIAAGLVAGESLAGVGLAIETVISGLMGG